MDVYKYLSNQKDLEISEATLMSVQSMFRHAKFQVPIGNISSMLI